ncbi:hypothetical protein [Agromyces sp. NPDC056965]|uniref:hypothetical protein n=1 Tax=Agromyces sp. NPDC056965 TaxID=3345983 RepID=UPI003626DE56
MIRRIVETVSSSRADDLAFHALADVSGILETIEDARIVGGQMVALLLDAFPSAGTVPRRTADADAAVSTVVAGSGILHQELTAVGYRATAGNSYHRSGRSIDLLIPAPAGRFTQEERGGRAFDAAPGLQLALATEPIIIDANVTMLDGSLLPFSVRVPPPEIAVILKAYAMHSRFAAKDAVDLHNLLTLVDSWPAADIGAWRLDRAQLRGSRSDAAHILHGFAETAQANPSLRAAEISGPRLVALIRKHVTRVG